MASVEKRGNSWRLIAFLGYDDLGKQDKRTMTISAEGISKHEAQKLANEFETEELKNKSINDRNMTFTKFIDYWKENYGSKESERSITTQERDDQLLVRIRKSLGEIRLRKLEPKHILAFIKNLEEEGVRMDTPGEGKLSDRSVQMHFKLVSSILTKAVKWKFLKENPCRSVDTPRAKSKKIPIYDEPTLLKFLYLLLTKAKLKYQAFFLLGLTSGLRRSEILGLRWKDIDFEKSFLRVNQTAVRAKGKGIAYKDETKTAESAAPVPISPFTLSILLKLKNEQDQLKEKADDKWANKTGILFCTIEGRPMLPSSFGHWIEKFSTRHGLPKISPHAFRHMAATYALDRGFDLKFVSDFIRHADIGTTGNIYAHVLQPKNQQLVAALDDLVKAAMKTQQPPDPTHTTESPMIQ